MNSMQDGTLTDEVAQNMKRDYMKTPDAIIEAVTTMKASAKNSLDGIKEYCRENPGKVVGISLGAGALMGFALVKLLSRRPSSTERIISNFFRTGEDTLNQVRSGIKPILRNLKESFAD